MSFADPVSAPCDGARSKRHVASRQGQPWSEQEDEELRQAVFRHGLKSWGAVADAVPGRNPKSCALRWHSYLDPSTTHLSGQPFSAWETAIIIQAQAELGNSWAEIAKLLEGRSNSAVKNWWHVKSKELFTHGGSLGNRFLGQGLSLQQLLAVPARERRDGSSSAGSPSSSDHTSTTAMDGPSFPAKLSLPLLEGNTGPSSWRSSTTTTTTTSSAVAPHGYQPALAQRLQHAQGQVTPSTKGPNSSQVALSSGSAHPCSPAGSPGVASASAAGAAAGAATGAAAGAAAAEAKAAAAAAAEAKATAAAAAAAAAYMSNGRGTHSTSQLGQQQAAAAAALLEHGSRDCSLLPAQQQLQESPAGGDCVGAASRPNVTCSYRDPMPSDPCVGSAAGQRGGQERSSRQEAAVGQAVGSTEELMILPEQDGNADELMGWDWDFEELLLSAGEEQGHHAHKATARPAAAAAAAAGALPVAGPEAASEAEELAATAGAAAIVPAAAAAHREQLLQPSPGRFSPRVPAAAAAAAEGCASAAMLPAPHPPRSACYRTVAGPASTAAPAAPARPLSGVLQQQQRAYPLVPAWRDVYQEGYLAGLRAARRQGTAAAAAAAASSFLAPWEAMVGGVSQQRPQSLGMCPAPALPMPPVKRRCLLPAGTAAAAAAAAVGSGPPLGLIQQRCGWREQVEAADQPGPAVAAQGAAGRARFKSPSGAAAQAGRAPSRAGSSQRGQPAGPWGTMAARSGEPTRAAVAAAAQGLLGVSSSPGVEAEAEERAQMRHMLQSLSDAQLWEMAAAVVRAGMAGCRSSSR